MMTEKQLNELKSEAAVDLKITEQNALQKTLEVPNLFQKYLSYFIRESMILKKMRIELDRFYGEKFRYYRENYTRELNKGEIDIYINSDPEYVKKNNSYQYQELVCRYLEEITQKAKNLSFDLKNFIDLRIFLGGGR